MIRAAGIVLWREKSPFDVEILLVHRPQMDDWSFPKGKVEKSENTLAAALRELEEETGYLAEIGQYLGATSYKIDQEKKKVKYWMAKSLSQKTEFQPNNEVDRIEWLPIKMVRHFLSYEEDRDILDEFKTRERHTNSLILLRHAKAIKRSEWSAYDAQRPLSADGELQSRNLIKQLAGFSLSGVHTSDAIRCISTVEELAINLGLPLNISQEINEESFEKDSKKIVSFIRQLLKYDGNHLVCTHNPIIPFIVESLVKHATALENSVSPSEGFVVHHLGEKIFAVDFLNRPKDES